jgi:hypothetical protein
MLYYGILWSITHTLSVSVVCVQNFISDAKVFDPTKLPQLVFTQGVGPDEEDHWILALVAPEDILSNEYVEKWQDGGVRRTHFGEGLFTDRYLITFDAIPYCCVFCSRSNGIRMPQTKTTAIWSSNRFVRARI